MTATAEFWDRVARGYAKRPISNVDAYEKTLERTSAYLKSTDRAIELGCGTGSTALRLAPFVEKYVGTDVSGEMIEIANEKLAETSQKNLDFRVATATKRAFARETFDVVLGFNLLHLLPDLEGSLSDIRQTLPLGGRFISKTPCLGGKWYLRPVIGAMRLVGKAPFVRFLSVEEMDSIVEASGFRILETGLYPPSAPSRFIVAEKV